ncbi:unnamed protein product [Mycena citricolor]|uniref:Uncharacterized protein n=1 Tax=Mycena citricolor TaxID=2018698 RepID=A0AAD2Q2V8_9AGAR|nr:unnamed protein product [Mycena citricolor]
MPSRHILALLPPAWGHTLPYIHLTTRMLALDPELVVTIVQHDNFVPQMLREFGLCSFDTSRLKIQGVGDKDLQSSPANLEESLKQLTSGWLGVVPGRVAGRDPTRETQPATRPDPVPQTGSGKIPQPDLPLS